MYKQLKNLDLTPDSSILQTVNSFTEYFLAFNEKTNLVSKNDSKLLFEKHIYDSLALNLFFKKQNKQKIQNIIDIGTGGGFPSIPLALFFPEINVCATDSIKKKIDFINNVKNEYNIENLIPVCSRVEELPLNFKNFYDIAVSRAVAQLNTLLEYSIPFVKKGGYFIAYKSKKADEELNGAKNALKILNAEFVEKIEYNLPASVDNNRVLLVFKKTKSTPLIYPRKNGLPKKNPL